MQFPSKETVARLRDMYPPGTHVELISMDDSYTKLKPGDKGRVDFVDDGGILHIFWNSGSRLGTVYGVDHVRKIRDEKETAQFSPPTTCTHKQKPGPKPQRGR